MDSYVIFKTENFEKRLGKIDNVNQERILKDIQNKLVVNPVHNTKFLQGSMFKGKRSFRVGDYRVIFTICGECKKLGHNRHNGCEGKNHPDNQIILWDVEHRKEDYK